MSPASSVYSGMYHVYLLRSKKDKSFYIGYTGDLDKRLKEHNSGLVNYTSEYKPWSLVYYEGYISLLDAQKREKVLKYFGKSYLSLKLRIKDSLNKKEGAG